MNNSFKLFAALLLAGGFALSLSSCKDSEDTANGPTPEEMAQSKESASAQGLLSVLSFTSQLDSLPDNWYANNYTVEPTVGTVNDQSTPFVRYVPVQNKEEAIAKYNSIADQIISEGSTSATFNIENVGSVKFNVLDQADCIATLDMNIKQQPHLTQIRFVPASAMGENASLKGEPYYDFGDVVELTEAPGVKSYWVCVRPCSQKEKKSTSHWMSFNLNDWDSEDKGVSESSVNIKKITKSDYEDYYLPTQLGNKSESREHLQNLFKLLMIIHDPAKYSRFTNGLGGISKTEFTQDKVNDLRFLWIANDVWSKVLPKNVSRVDMALKFQSDNPEINVFYYGYHYNRLFYPTASVHRAKLSGPKLDLVEDGEIKWSRNKKGLDFRNYASDGQLTDNDDQNVGLPLEGFVVRYKTGRQLVGGGSGNDEDPTVSFTDKHSDIIQNIQAAGEIRDSHKGSSVLGDRIVNSDKTQEICVIPYYYENPKFLGDYSYYLKIKKASNEGEEVVMQDKQVSTLAYINLLNAIMYGKESDFIAKDAFSRFYASGLYSLYLNVDSQIQEASEYRLIDTNGNDFDETDPTSKLAKITITFPYKDSSIKDKNKYRVATLEYDINAKTYTVKPHSSIFSTAPGGYVLELRSYSDTGTESSPVLNHGQRFLEDTYTDEMERSNCREACSRYMQDILKTIR